MDRGILAESAAHFPRLSIALLVAAPIVYFIGGIIYNLYFHPLAKYPGPLICRASNLPWVRIEVVHNGMISH